MRKEAKIAKKVNISSVNPYHQRQSGNWDADSEQAYAYMGYSKNYFFNSDRKEETEVVNNRLVRIKSGKEVVGGGLEIEVQCNSIHNQNVLAEIFSKVILPHFKFGDDMFKMQNDGSLGGYSSLELITQPCSKGRIRNDYASYKAMFDNYFPTLGISADSYMTNCGMHVNLSNGMFGRTPEEQEESIRKLAYFINHHYDFCCGLFYRDRSRTDYCERMEYYNDKHTCQTFNIHDCCSSHGVCLNLGHYDAGRVEIRLVGGQRDFNVFRNTMESVFFLCEKLRKLSWDDLDNLATVFMGCNQYVYKRLNSSYCRQYMGMTIREAIYANIVPEDLDLVNDVETSF